MQSATPDRGTIRSELRCSPFNRCGLLASSIPEEVLFKSEQRQSREQIASFPQTVVTRLNAGEAITLRSGEDAVTLEPPADATFDVKAEREGPTDGPAVLRIEFEIEWDEDEASGGDLTID